MIYIPGDTHRDFIRLNDLEKEIDSMLIILGDAGINYFLNEKDYALKKYLNAKNIKMFCIQGNHEERPENIVRYKETLMFGGKVFIEDEFPNLIFAKNGQVYEIEGKSVLVIDGAYSVDKEYRLLYNHQWFKDEQLKELEKEEILSKYKGKHIDVILSHTCPLKYEPTEVLMKGIDQSKVDKSMEIFLETIEENIDYDKWYCGHFHTEKQIDKVEFMFGRIKVFGKDEFYPKYDNQGFEIIRDYCEQGEGLKGICPKCKSEDVYMLKGNGFNILGSDIIGIGCHACKKYMVLMMCTMIIIVLESCD